MFLKKGKKMLLTSVEHSSSSSTAPEFLPCPRAREQQRAISSVAIPRRPCVRWPEEEQPHMRGHEVPAGLHGDGRGLRAWSRGGRWPRQCPAGQRRLPVEPRAAAWRRPLLRQLQASHRLQVSSSCLACLHARCLCLFPPVPLRSTSSSSSYSL